MYITAVLIIVLLAVMVIINKQQKPEETGELKIVTTLFPLYDSAKHIAGENAEISLLLPPGIEAHSFEPKPSDIAQISNADVFVYTGDFMEPWAKDLLSGIQNQNLIVVNASDGVDLITEEHDDDEHEDEHGHEHNGIDPHIWLDFGNMEIIAENIANGIFSADQENGKIYIENLDAYKNALKNLDEKYKNDLSECETDTIIHAGHFAFGYMAKKYAFEYIATQGFSPNSEPTAKDIAGIIDLIKQQKTKYIYYEEMVNPTVANAISNETSAGLLELHGAHNISKKEMENGETFINIMENNLTNLRKGLGCE